MSQSVVRSVVRQAARRLLTTPAYSVSVVLTLSVGLAAITFVSAIGYGVLLRPLSFPAPEQLVTLSTTDSSGRPSGVSLPDVEDWRHQTTSFQSVGAWIDLDGALETPAGSDYAFRTTVTAARAMTALLLAGIGIYGVAAQSAMLRRKELAVRTALGGQRRALMVLMLSEALRPCVVGAACGVGLAVVGQRLSRSSLTGVPSIDLSTVALAVTTAMVVSMCVAVLPAWRATSVRPWATLRS
jgi:predicted lysophospholipase L1 biosynthesis ABC-type transport system permease subunit